MTVTIDRAGRLVIPKSIRSRLNLQPGTELEIELRGNEISLKVSGYEPALIEKNGVLVHHGPEVSGLDIAKFIRGEREARSSRTASDIVGK